MFSNFYQLDSHNKTCVVTTNLQWDICKNQISHNLFMVTESARLLNFQLDTWVLPIVIIVANIVQSLLNMCLYDACSLILTEPHTYQF